jgi:N-acetylmuramoyl-L-alanine amidase
MIRKALLLTVTVATATLAAAAPTAARNAVARSSVSRRALTCPAQTFGSVDVPADGATVSGYVQVKGFALDGNLVSNVDVFVDGTGDANRITTAGGANINIPRPDIIQAFPQYAGSPGQYPGWQAYFWAGNFSNGSHTIYVGVTDTTGCQYFLTPRAIKIDNTKNEAPFGNMDFPQQPYSSVQASGILTVTGWALDDQQVDHVDIVVDGLLERQAVTGIYRADVAANFPNDPAAIVAGFVLNLDTTKYANGVHSVSARAVDNQGQQGFLGSSQVQIFNNAPNIAPIGAVEFPLVNSTWFGNCFPVSPAGPSGGPATIIDPRFLMFVNGWALEAAVDSTGGVSEVRVALDGVPLLNSRIDCHREFLLANALIDCYGYYRPDLEVLYPGFAQVPNVGFHFDVDVGYLITQKGFKEGAHILQVSAVDKRNTAVLLQEVPIQMECATGNLDPPPVGYIDDPTNYKFINGIFPVIGWALDLDVVIKVRILIDGVAQIDAVTGVDYADYGYASPDVAATYPSYPQSRNARFRFYLDTTKLSNSEHDLLIEVTDARGNVRSAGTRRFIVDNNTLVR